MVPECVVQQLPLGLEMRYVSDFYAEPQLEVDTEVKTTLIPLALLQRTRGRPSYRSRAVWEEKARSARVFSPPPTRFVAGQILDSWIHGRSAMGETAWMVGWG